MSGAMDRGQLAAIARAVDRLSGSRRSWVNAARVLEAVTGSRCASLEDALQHHPWWEGRGVAPFAALVELIRRGLVEGRGNFGVGFDPPADPVYSECRRGARSLDEVLAVIATLGDPGALVTRFDPRTLAGPGRVGPLRLGAPLPGALEPPWSLQAVADGESTLCFDGCEVAGVRHVDGVVAMLAPVITGMAVDGATVGETIAALRARWGDQLVEDPARARMWHRERPTVIVSEMLGHADLVAMWSRAHLIRAWIAWAVAPELVTLEVLRDGRRLFGIGRVATPPPPGPGFHVGWSPLPAGPLELGPLSPGPCELAIAPAHAGSRLAPVHVATRTGDLDVRVELRYGS